MINGQSTKTDDVNDSELLPLDDPLLNILRAEVTDLEDARGTGREKAAARTVRHTLAALKVYPSGGLK